MFQNALLCVGEAARGRENEDTTYEINFQFEKIVCQLGVGEVLSVTVIVPAFLVTCAFGLVGSSPRKG